MCILYVYIYIYIHIRGCRAEDAIFRRLDPSNQLAITITAVITTIITVTVSINSIRSIFVTAISFLFCLLRRMDVSTALSSVVELIH